MVIHGQTMPLRALLADFAQCPPANRRCLYRWPLWLSARCSPHCMRAGKTPHALADCTIHALHASASSLDG